MNIRTLLNAFSFTLLCTLLAGCGWHLRGHNDNAVQIKSLQVQSSFAYGKLERALQAEMRAKHIDDNASHAWHLTILDQELRQNVLAYNDSINAAMLELELVVHFTVTNDKGETVIAPNRERVVRPFETDNNRALATDRERDLLRDEIYREMAGNLLRRIDFIASQKQ